MTGHNGPIRTPEDLAEEVDYFRKVFRTPREVYSSLWPRIERVVELHSPDPKAAETEEALRQTKEELSRAKGEIAKYAMMAAELERKLDEVTTSVSDRALSGSEEKEEQQDLKGILGRWMELIGKAESTGIAKSLRAEIGELKQDTQTALG